MNTWSWKRLGITILIGLVAWCAVAAICVMVGSTGGFRLPRDSAVIRIRIETVLLASLIGAALASAGVVYQAILRNPLADPYLLGASSGAMLASYLWQLPMVTIAAALGQQACAFSGAIAAVGIVLLIAGRRGRIEPITLLLVGVIVNAMNGSIFLLLNSIIKDPATPGGPLAFLVGGIQTNLQLRQEIIAAVCVGVGWILLLWISGSLNAAVLSDGEAQSLGVRIHRLRWGAMIAASLVTAAAVAISGPIGFVGLICPHLARRFVGNDHRKLLPVATALGAAMLAVADAGTRMLAGTKVGTVLPVGVLTGLLGGPFFLVLLLRRRST